jgi:hypothetical protein
MPPIPKAAIRSADNSTASSSPPDIADLVQIKTHLFQTFGGNPLSAREVHPCL